ncbi:MAG: hypothetical protein PF447_06090 [Spirochaetaceae bacterium]|jgi:hypothetical protein|nr:hypothetical protein [Spirochaetaceae bacterium]
MTEIIDSEAYGDVIEIAPGEGWGASSSCVAFQEIGKKFHKNYSTLTFKIKSTSGFYLF